VAEFHYQGVNDSGSPVSGTVQAPDRRAAIAHLKERGHFATRLAEKNESEPATAIRSSESFKSLGSFLRFGVGRVSSRDILAFTTQLSAALRAGLPLLDCLRIIEKQSGKKVLRELLEDLIHGVSSGESLSDAMARYPRIFRPLYLAMIRVGETGGILENTTAQLSQLLKREEQIKSNIRNASAYPLFVLGIGLVSILVVITWILPRIVGVVQESGVALPLPTRILLGLSDFVAGFGWIVALAGMAGVYLLHRWIQTPRGRWHWDSMKLKLPVFGSVFKTLAVGRFTRMLGALSSGGIAILESLHVVRDTLGNERLGREIDRVAGLVKTGESLAEPLGESGYFPPLLVQIVSVGEQAGKLDELLLGAADTFDEQADNAISRFMSILPAMLVVLLAVVIGCLIAAILLPVVMMELGAGSI